MGTGLGTHRLDNDIVPHPAQKIKGGFSALF